MGGASVFLLGVKGSAWGLTFGRHQMLLSAWKITGGKLLGPCISSITLSVCFAVSITSVAESPPVSTDSGPAAPEGMATINV